MTVERDFDPIRALQTLNRHEVKYVLIGGFDKSVALQPLSVEGQTGLNVAAGIGAINLRHDVG